MKLLLILSLVTITLAGFCIEGSYYYDYSSYGDGFCSSGNYSYGTIIINTVNIIRNNVFMVINVNELAVGDKIKSYDYQYTEVLSLDRYMMFPEIISDNNRNSLFLSPVQNTVFTDSEAVTYKSVSTGNGYSNIYYTELVNLTHSTVNPHNTNVGYCNNCSNGYCYSWPGSSMSLYSLYEEYNSIDLYYFSDMVNYIKHNLLNQYIIIGDSGPVYYYRNLTIVQCEAVKVITANGYIMVNNILFRN